MCFLVGVLVRVQAPRWISGASNHAPTTMGTTIALLSIATTFFVLVANEGSFESLRSLMSIQVIGRRSSGQQRCLNGGFRRRL